MRFDRPQLFFSARELSDRASSQRRVGIGLSGAASIS